ncbi:MAG: GerAB/ArcD/ProY family transporter [Oscillospiraceae bacterium]|nr:GerAB/ArcD/ProY family transporter [Oscillospiraceae bacterium]
MRNDAPKISRRQLLAMLYASRCTALLYPFRFLGQAYTARELALAALLLCALSVLAEAAGRTAAVGDAPPRGIPAAAVCAALLFAQADAFAQFRGQLAGVLENAQPEAPLVILSLAALWYALKKGIEGCARFSSLCAVFGLVCAGSILLFSASKFDAVKLAPAAGVTLPGFAAAFARLLPCPELLLFLVLSPYANERLPFHSAARFLRVQAAALAAFSVFCAGVLGRLSLLADTPAADLLSSVAESTVFRRMDAARTCVFILLLLVRMIAISAGMRRVLGALLPRPDRAAVPAAVALSAAAAALAFFAASQRAAPEALGSALCAAAALYLLIARRRSP